MSPGTKNFAARVAWKVLLLAVVLSITWGFPVFVFNSRVLDRAAEDGNAWLQRHHPEERAVVTPTVDWREGFPAYVTVGTVDNSYRLRCAATRVGEARRGCTLLLAQDAWWRRYP